MFPLEGNSAGYLVVTNEAVRLVYDPSLPAVGNIPLETPLDTDHEWHHIGVTRNEAGRLSCTIDAVEVNDIIQLVVSSDPQEMVK